MTKLFTFIALLLALGVPATAAEKRLPNIVFVLADDLGYGDVKCYNPECKFPTPNLGRVNEK